MDGLIFISVMMGLLFFAIGLKAWYDYSRHKRELKAHMHEVAVSGHFAPIKKKSSLVDKLLERLFHYADDFASLGHRINFFSESHDVERWLTQANHPYNLTVERFQGVKICLMIVGFIAGIAAFILRLPFSQYAVVLLPVVGYFSAIILLRNKAKKRQLVLSYTLPDFLDTVSVTLQAGVSLDQAFRDIIPYFDGPVREEFARFNHEISLGVPREEAYRKLLNRNDNPEFQKLIKSLIQGSRLGVPVATTFKIQAEEMRTLKKEKVKEKAAKASPKVTLITTFIVMPSAMILIAGLMIMNMFSGDNSIFEIFN